MSRKTSTLPTTLAPGIPDRGGAVVNGALLAVPGDQDGVVRQPDDHALLQCPQRRVLDRLAGVLVDDAEHVLQGAARGFLGLPADKLLGDRVEEVDPALGVGADDGIADARQRDVQPLPLLLDQPGVLLGHTAGRASSARRRAFSSDCFRSVKSRGDLREADETPGARRAGP